MLIEASTFEIRWKKSDFEILQQEIFEFRIFSKAIVWVFDGLEVYFKQFL